MLKLVTQYTEHQEAKISRHHEEAWGVIAALADGVSSGGLGLEAAQTTVGTLLSDYYATPATWDTT
ncbi:hypothetical protein EON65_37310, partial [archaeon]